MSTKQKAAELATRVTNRVYNNPVLAANKEQFQKWAEELIETALLDKEMEIHAVCAEFLKIKVEQLAREIISPRVVSDTMQQRGIRFFRARRKLREVSQ